MVLFTGDQWILLELLVEEDRLDFIAESTIVDRVRIVVRPVTKSEIFDRDRTEDDEMSTN